MNSHSRRPKARRQYRSQPSSMPRSLNGHRPPIAVARDEAEVSTSKESSVA